MPGVNRRKIAALKTARIAATKNKVTPTISLSSLLPARPRAPVVSPDDSSSVSSVSSEEEVEKQAEQAEADDDDDDDDDYPKEPVEEDIMKKNGTYHSKPNPDSDKEEYDGADALEAAYKSRVPTMLEMSRRKIAPLKGQSKITSAAAESWKFPAPTIPPKPTPIEDPTSSSKYPPLFQRDAVTVLTPTPTPTPVKPPAQVDIIPAAPDSEPMWAAHMPDIHIPYIPCPYPTVRGTALTSIAQETPAYARYEDEVESDEDEEDEEEVESEEDEEDEDEDESDEDEEDEVEEDSWDNEDDQMDDEVEDDSEEVVSEEEEEEEEDSNAKAVAAFEARTLTVGKRLEPYFMQLVSTNLSAQDAITNDSGDDYNYFTDFSTQTWKDRLPLEAESDVDEPMNPWDETMEGILALAPTPVVAGEAEEPRNLFDETMAGILALGTQSTNVEMEEPAETSPVGVEGVGVRVGGVAGGERDVSSRLSDAFIAGRDVDEAADAALKTVEGGNGSRVFTGAAGIVTAGATLETGNIIMDVGKAAAIYPAIFLGSPEAAAVTIKDAPQKASGLESQNQIMELPNPNTQQNCNLTSRLDFIPDLFNDIQIDPSIYDDPSQLSDLANPEVNIEIGCVISAPAHDQSAFLDHSVYQPGTGEFDDSMEIEIGVSEQFAAPSCFPSEEVNGYGFSDECAGSLGWDGDQGMSGNTRSVPPEVMTWSGEITAASAVEQELAWSGVGGAGVGMNADIDMSMDIDVPVFGQDMLVLGVVDDLNTASENPESQVITGGGAIVDKLEIQGPNDNVHATPAYSLDTSRGESTTTEMENYLAVSEDDIGLSTSSGTTETNRYIQEKIPTHQDDEHPIISGNGGSTFASRFEIHLGNLQEEGTPNPNQLDPGAELVASGNDELTPVSTLENSQENNVQEATKNSETTDFSNNQASISASALKPNPNHLDAELLAAGNGGSTSAISLEVYEANLQAERNALVAVYLNKQKSISKSKASVSVLGTVEHHPESAEIYLPAVSENDALTSIGSPEASIPEATPNYLDLEPVSGNDTGPTASSNDVEISIEVTEDGATILQHSILEHGNNSNSTPEPTETLQKTTEEGTHIPSIEVDTTPDSIFHTAEPHPNLRSIDDQKSTEIPDQSLADTTPTQETNHHEVIQTEDTSEPTALALLPNHTDVTDTVIATTKEEAVRPQNDADAAIEVVAITPTRGIPTTTAGPKLPTTAIRLPPQPSAIPRPKTRRRRRVPPAPAPAPAQIPHISQPRKNWVEKVRGPNKRWRYVLMSVDGIVEYNDVLDHNETPGSSSFAAEKRERERRVQREVAETEEEKEDEVQKQDEKSENLDRILEMKGCAETEEKGENAEGAVERKDEGVEKKEGVVEMEKEENKEAPEPEAEQESAAILPPENRTTELKGDIESANIPTLPVPVPYAAGVAIQAEAPSHIIATSSATEAPSAAPTTIPTLPVTTTRATTPATTTIIIAVLLTFLLLSPTFLSTLWHDLTIILSTLWHDLTIILSTLWNDLTILLPLETSLLHAGIALLPDNFGTRMLPVLISLILWRLYEAIISHGLAGAAAIPGECLLVLVGLVRILARWKTALAWAEPGSMGDEVGVVWEGVPWEKDVVLVEVVKKINVVEALGFLPAALPTVCPPNNLGIGPGPDLSLWEKPMLGPGGGGAGAGGHQVRNGVSAVGMVFFGFLAYGSGRRRGGARRSFRG